jgi:hypothetical protein
MMVYALINEMKVDGKSTIGLEPTKGDDYMKIEVEDTTPDGGLYMNHGRALVSGRRIKLDHVSKQMKQYSAGIIPDYQTTHGFICVTDKFKSVVEAVEPGVHQFIPFEVVGAGKKNVANLWFMVVCNRLDSVDREHTTLVLDHGEAWLSAREVSREQWPAHIRPDTPSRLVFSLLQIGKHHLWFDKHIETASLPYVSAKLAEALKTAGVTGVSFKERETV